MLALNEHEGFMRSLVSPERAATAPLAYERPRGRDQLAICPRAGAGRQEVRWSQRGAASDPAVTSGPGRGLLRRGGSR